MRFIYDLFGNHIRAALTPGRHLAIDETLYAFRAHCAHRQFKKTKPARNGQKYNNIVDVETTYLLDTNPYLGKSNALNKNETNVGQKCVESLSEFFYGTKR